MQKVIQWMVKLIFQLDLSSETTRRIPQLQFYLQFRGAGNVARISQTKLRTWTSGAKKDRLLFVRARQMGSPSVWPKRVMKSTIFTASLTCGTEGATR